MFNLRLCFGRLTLLGLSALVCSASVAGLTRDETFRQLDSIVRTLSDISGLPEKHPVSYGRMDKRQLRTFLTKRMHKTLKQSDIEADELALKMMGFVPSDYDLRRSTLDLLTEQSAAFYDYDARRLFLLRGSNEPGETVTLAHELSHALADQNFNLSRYVGDSLASDDENLAHTAVVEGEACWLMLAYSSKQGGGSGEPTSEMLNSLTHPDEAVADDFPVLTNAPLYIRESLLFPYGSGTSFFEAVYRKLGKAAFAYVFANPPAGTSQVLHPDRYFSRIGDRNPALPEAGPEHKIETANEGTVGEFDHSILIRQYTTKRVADDLSPHLRGGHFAIVRAGGSKPLLRYASEWDSAENAQRFFEVYLKIVSGKSERFKLSYRGEQAAAGSTERGLFLTSRIRNVVQSLEGMEDEREWRDLVTRMRSQAGSPDRDRFHALANPRKSNESSSPPAR